jgi:hypothetical protein
VNGIVAQTPSWRPVETVKCVWHFTAEQEAEFQRALTWFWAVWEAEHGEQRAP